MNEVSLEKISKVQDPDWRATMQDICSASDECASQWIRSDDE
jgi:hypothetical protein